MAERYTDFWNDGEYRCMKCGNPLFASGAKFTSGTMWPSFRKSMPGAVTTQHDSALGMERTELLCEQCRQHLGHVFDDGKTLGDTHPEAGQRYCILSDALQFKAAENEKWVGTPPAGRTPPLPPARSPWDLFSFLGNLSSKPPMVAYLGFLLVLGAWTQKSPALVLRGLVILFVYSAFDVVIGYGREKKWILPTSAWISGLILCLVLSPTASWGTVVAAPILASLGKQFIRFRRKHIFNPAALALVLLGLVFPGQGIISWWGASWGPLATTIIALAGAVTIFRVKRWKTALAFVALYGIVGSFLFSNSDVANRLSTLLWDGTLLFFATVILIEPVTTAYTPTPIRTWFGASVAVLTLLFSLPETTVPVPDPFLVSLLLGNLGATLVSRRTRR